MKAPDEDNSKNDRGRVPMSDPAGDRSTERHRDPKDPDPKDPDLKDVDPKDVDPKDVDPKDVDREAPDLKDVVDGDEGGRSRSVRAVLWRLAMAGVVGLAVAAIVAVLVHRAAVDASSGGDWAELGGFIAGGLAGLVCGALVYVAIVAGTVPAAAPEGRRAGTTIAAIVVPLLLVVALSLEAIGRHPLALVSVALAPIVVVAVCRLVRWRTAAGVALVVVLAAGALSALRGSEHDEARDRAIRTWDHPLALLHGNTAQLPFDGWHLLTVSPPYNNGAEYDTVTLQWRRTTAVGDENIVIAFSKQSRSGRCGALSSSCETVGQSSRGPIRVDPDAQGYFVDVDGGSWHLTTAPTVDLQQQLDLFASLAPTDAADFTKVVDATPSRSS